MSEETQNDATNNHEETTTTETTANDKPAGGMTLEEALAELKKVRSESASRRVENKKLSERLEALEKANQEAEDKKLADQQEYKTLAEKYKTDAAQLAAQLKAKDTEILRVRVAAEFGLNVPIDEESGETLADRLRGDTLDELREDAQKLAKLFAKPEPAPEQETTTTEETTQQQGQEARRPTTTTDVPGGPAVGRTDVDRRREYFGTGSPSPAFRAGGLTLTTKTKNITGQD